MEPFWTGHIQAREGDPVIVNDFKLYSESKESHIPANAKLSLLSFVDCTRIPLHIICGAAYEAIGSRTWIHDTLLDSIEYPDAQDDRNSDVQVVESRIGALVRIDPDGKARKSKTNITELLLYARIDQAVNHPSDSNPQNPHVNARIFALPLSSHLLYDPSRYSIPPTPPPETDTTVVNGVLLQPVDLGGCDKRKRLNDMFEDASKPRKKLKRQDSQDPARLMPSRSNSPLLVQGDRTDGQRNNNSSTMRLHSRAQSLTSVRVERPISRGNTIERARSSLSRVASTGVLSRPTSKGSGGNENPAINKYSTTEDRNKKLLSNMVMASMRMRGMSQKRGEMIGQPQDESEYKLMYHNTFKAANFALRIKMQEEIEADTFRDVVDLLLDLFCGDGGGGIGGGGGFNGESQGTA